MFLSIQLFFILYFVLLIKFWIVKGYYERAGALRKSFADTCQICPPGTYGNGVTCTVCKPGVICLEGIVIVNSIITCQFNSNVFSTFLV